MTLSFSLVATDVRSLIPYCAKEIRASLRRLLQLVVAAALVGASVTAFAAAEADLLVAYDSSHASAVGGEDNAQVLAANAVAGSNAINERSGTGARVRICGYHQAAQNLYQTTSKGGFVNWMASYDSRMTDVVDAGNARGADLVTWICVSTADGAAAVAQQPGRYSAFDPGSFWSAVVAHELAGHNYGCDHRGGKGDLPGAYPKTVMMHNYCNGGGSSPPYFYSNPNIWLGGTRLQGVGSTCLGAAVDGGDNAYLVSTTCQGVADRNARVIVGPNLGNVVRRWSFNQAAGSAPAGTTVTDSVSGTALATVQGNGATFTGSGVLIPGGASGSGAAYLQLPAGVLSAYSNVTLEIWAKEVSAQNWARVMDFNNGTANYIMLAACRGTDLNLQRFDSAFSGTYVTLDSDIATTAGVLHHYAVTYTSTGGSTGRWTWYRDGDQVAYLDVAYALSALQDVNNWLGRSAYVTDAFANCEYQEVRISSVAMSRDQVLANYTLGPNRVASTVRLTADDPLGSASFAAAGNWSDGLAPSAGKTYETYRFRLRTPADGTSRTFAGQTLTIDGGSITWKGTSSSSLTVNNLTLSGDCELLNAGSGTFTLAGSATVKSDEVMVRAANGPINITANLSGSGNMLHVNNTVTLSGNNSNFTGKTIVGDGRFSSISIDSEARLGANPATFTADQLTFNRGVLYNAGNLTISNANRGIRVGPSAALFNVAPGTTLTLAVPLSSPSSGASLVTTPLFPNPVSGMLIKDNTGTLVLTHPNNSHVGEIIINGGNFIVAGPGRLNNGDQPMPIVNNGTLTFNTTANQILGGVISGNGQLIKSNTSTLTLYGANTYTGDTTINGGTLTLNGSASLASPNIVVGSGAIFNVSAISYALASGVTLKGNGAISGSVTTAGASSIQPGLSAGTLTFSNNLNMSAGGNATFELSTTAATGNDRINVTGNLTVTSADAIHISAFGGAANLDTSADYVLFAVSGTTTMSTTPMLVWDGTRPANYDHYYLTKIGNNVVLRYTAATPPALTAVGSPSVLVRNQAVTITATVTPGSGVVTNVQADVSAIGGSATAPLVLSSVANVYTNTFAVAASTTPGVKLLTVAAFDDSPLTASDAFTSTVVATNKIWTGLGGDNNWSSNPNWSTGGPGLAGDSVAFAGSTRLTPAMNNNYNVTGVTFNSGAGSFTVGTASSTVTLSGGVTNNSVNLQNLNVPITLNSAQPFNAAAGNLTFGQPIANGGNLITVIGPSNTAFSAVSGTGGLTKTGTGTLTLAGNYTASGTFQVNGGTGVVSSAVSPGSSEVWAGEGTGSLGTINVDAGGTLTVNNWLVAGRNTGTGTINVNGGTISHMANNITVGAFGAGCVGYLNLHSGTVTTSGELWVGESRTGTFNQSGGSVTSGQWFVIARNSTAVGTYNLTGGNAYAATVNAGSFPVIGSFAGAVGTMNVSGGSFNTPRMFYIGEGGTGTLTVSGTGAVNVTNSTEGLRLGRNSGGVGTVNLNGGTIQCALVSQGAGSGTFNFNGGTLKGLSPVAGLMTGLTRANVRNGGAVIDTAGSSFTIAQALLHSNIGGDSATDGGLTKTGTGTLTLTGANTYTGNTVISNGTLVLSGSGAIGNSASINVSAGANLDVSAGSFTLGVGQTLKGNGTVNGPATINGTVAPGTAVGTLTFATAPVLNGTVLMELNRTNAQTSDRLILSTGTLNLGGTLTVTNIGAALQSGDSFQLFSAPNVAGAFAATNLPPLSAGLVWSFSSGVLSVGQAVATNPTNITFSVVGNQLQIGWPTDHTGWRLQTQTNGLNANDWYTVPGSTNVSSLLLPLSDETPISVFFRLVYP